MPTAAKPLQTCATRFALALALVAAQGCATRGLPDVGAVVVAPKPQIPPEPTLVTQTEPMPAGWFLQSLKDCCLIGLKRPTPSTSPTQAAGKTPGN